jgi:hypothetical protein
MPAYEIRIANKLGVNTAVYFPEFTIHHPATGGTILTGPVTDQAALHGVLARIRDFGLTLLACNIIEKAHPSPEKE